MVCFLDEHVGLTEESRKMFLVSTLNCRWLCLLCLFLWTRNDKRAPLTQIFKRFSVRHVLLYTTTTMVEPVARIRPFQTSDDKDVRFAIGKGSLESLAVANRKGQSISSTLLFFLLKWVVSSLLSSFDTCTMGIILIHLHPSDGLVA